MIKVIKEMKGWKVITDSRMSAINQCYAINYPVNVEVFPKIKGSKLFFFKYKKDANSFCKSFYSNAYIIVPCIARNVTTPKWMSFSLYEIPQFWACKNKSKFKFISGVVSGTLFAESITCLK